MKDRATVEETDSNIRFKNIYITHYAKLRRFAIRYVLSEEDAENIVQDVFLTLLEKKEDLPTNLNLLAFLFTLIKNKCIDHLRNLTVRQNVAEEMKKEHHIALRMSLNSLEVFDLNQFSENDIETTLARAIDSLPAKCREIFILSKIEGQKQKDIAQSLNITVNTVESQIGIAYKKLRTELKDYLPLLFFFLSL